MMLLSTLPFESKKGLAYRRVADDDYADDSVVEIGTDEVSRGCLFGNTFAAAVALPPLAALSPEGRRVLALANDSKAVPRAKLAALAADIRRTVRAFAICHVEAVDIDEMNIRQAVIRAMREAVCDVRSQLGGAPERCYVLADGKDLQSVVYRVGGGVVEDLPVVTEVKADAKYVAVACASILAKDASCSYIRDLCAEYPELVERYALDRNHGYGTKVHLKGLLTHGPTYWHRQSFAPVRRAVISFAPKARELHQHGPLGVPFQRVFTDLSGRGGCCGFGRNEDDEEEEDDDA